jgi:hypothetical protein
MKKIVRLTESDLARIIKRVINEQGQSDPTACFKAALEIEEMDVEVPKSCMEAVTKPSFTTMAACSFEVLLMAPTIGLPTDPSEIEEKVKRFYECTKSKVKY